MFFAGLTVCRNTPFRVAMDATRFEYWLQTTQQTGMNMFPEESLHKPKLGPSQETHLQEA